MKMRMVGVCVFLLALTLSFEAYAQQPSYGQRFSYYNNYLVLKGGIFYPQGDIKDLNAGFNGELAYGFRFSRYGAVEIGSGYFEANGTSRASFAGSGLSLNGNWYGIPLTIAIKPIIPLSRQFEVYGLAGGGGYYLHSSGGFTVPAGRISGSEDAAVTGGFLGAGVTCNITKQIFMGLEGKYLWTSSAKLKGNIAQVPFDANVKIQGVQFTLNYGCRF